MELHHFPQDYISSRMGAEAKLSKSQQINAINVKNVQDMVHVQAHESLTGKIGNMWFEGHKGIFNPLKQA